MTSGPRHRLIAVGAWLLVAAGVLVLLLAAAGSPGAGRPGFFNPTARTRLSNGTVPLERFFCGAGAGYPGVHFYRTAPSSPSAGSALPPAPASPAPQRGCRFEQTIGYVLPPSRPAIGTVGFYFFPLRHGANFYAVAAGPAAAARIARFLASRAMLIGYVRPPAGNTCPAADSAPLWRFSNARYQFFTTAPAEVVPHALVNGGVTACLFTSPAFDRLRPRF